MLLATWEDYFKLSTGGLGLKYQYKDTSVKVLPENLPMPPTDRGITFNGCHDLVDISALSDWDTTNITDMCCMFNHCHSLRDISPLKQWKTKNVTNMEYMFNCCRKLDDISPLSNWDVSNVTKMRFIFNGCHALPKEIYLEVHDSHKFSIAMDKYITSRLYTVTYYPEYEEEESILEGDPFDVLARTIMRK